MVSYGDLLFILLIILIAPPSLSHLFIIYYLFYIGHRCKGYYKPCLLSFDDLVVSLCPVPDPPGSAERSLAPQKRKVSSPTHSSNGHSPSDTSPSPLKKKKKPGAVNSNNKDQVRGLIYSYQNLACSRGGKWQCTHCKLVLSHQKFGFLKEMIPRVIFMVKPNRNCLFCYLST